MGACVLTRTIFQGPKSPDLYDLTDGQEAEYWQNSNKVASYNGWLNVRSATYSGVAYSNVSTFINGIKAVENVSYGYSSVYNQFIWVNKGWSITQSRSNGDVYYRLFTKLK